MPPKSRRTNNLQPAASSFVGRASDVSSIQERLDRERLVTILGPGGIGKTRLALRVAETCVDGYAAHGGGGVWFCDLTEAADASAVASAVAATLGLEFDAAASAALLSARVGRALAARGRVLLVLDNFEGVVSHAAATVGEWLRAAPSARFLVTSRIALGLPGEQRSVVPPMERDDAIELFARRARQVRPSFDPAAEGPNVATIIDAVERIPLAIELAATRIAVLSTAQLRDRLASPRTDRLLSAPGETARHHSMRRTVLDSVALLDDRARELFVALSCTKNGVTLEAVEAIVGGDALDLLGILVRHSLVRTHVESGDLARYSIFEVIRAVADELAEGRDLVTQRRAHYEHYARVALEGRVAEGDLENLLLAFAIAIEDLAPNAHGASAALSIAVATHEILSLRGRLATSGQILDRAMHALARAGGAVPVEAYLARGVVRRELGDSVAAREDFEEALAAARAANDPAHAAVALTRLGGMSDVAGDTETARALLVEALSLLERTPAGGARARREAESLLLLGHARRREGALDDARRAVRQAADRYQDLGHHAGLAAAMYEMAIVDMFAGRHGEAFDRFDEGLAAADRAGSCVWTGALKTARGSLLQDLGRADEASAHHAEAARIFREAGTRHREASALYYLATTFLERGAPHETEATLRRARDTLEGVGAARYEALIDACLASALSMRGDHASASEAIARAERACRLVKNEPALLANVRIHRRVVAHAAGLARGAATLAQAEAWVEASPSDDSRFALRILRRLLGSAPPSPAIATLVVEQGGRAFLAPSATDPVSLPARSPLRRILEALTIRRIEEPGTVLPIEGIIAAGWPGERITTQAASNRAYVALASLRKLGLRDVLVSDGGGYAFSESVVVRISRERLARDKDR
jgi:predicted ATPase